VIGTVVVSYKRPELLRQTLVSYLETVTYPYRLVVVDNGGCEEALEVADDLNVAVAAMDSNLYPGCATNVGWDALVAHAPVYLHRSDNDVEYLPGWCNEVCTRFEENPNLGQLGLRTLAEEGAHPNVGGNCVVRPPVFRKVRWREDSWAPGQATEDYYYTKDVVAAGYEWGRVKAPCIVHHGNGDPQTDSYYAETWTAKGFGGY